MGVRKHSVIMTAPVRRNEPVVLAVILIVATLVRLWGLGSGMPGLYQPHEVYFVGAARRLMQGSFLPNSFSQPPLYSYLLAVVAKLIQLLAELTSTVGLLDAAKPAVDIHDSLLHLIGRGVSCLFGIAGVGAIYLLGRVAYGDVTGLIGAALLALNFSHVRESHFATPATIFIFFLLISLTYTLKIADRAEPRSYLLFGITAALSALSSYAGILLLAPFLLAHLSYSFRKRNVVSPTDQAKRLLTALFAAVATFALLNPGFVLESAQALKEFSVFASSLPQGNGIERGGWERLGPLSLGMGAGVWVSALAAAGFLFVLGEAAFVGRRKVAGLLLAAFPVAWGSMLLANRAACPQLVVPMVPLLLLLAVRVTWAVAERFLSPAAATSVTVLLLFTVATEPLTRTLQLGRVLAAPDTRTLLQRWLAETMVPGTPLALRQHYPYTRPELPAGVEAFELERLVTLETLRAKHETFYAVVDEFPPLPQLSPVIPGWLQRFLAEHGRVVATFDPRTEGATDGWENLVYDAAERNFLPVSGFESIAHAGPRLTVYAISGETKE